MCAIKVESTMSLVLDILMNVAHAVRAARNGAGLATSQHGYSVYELFAPVPPITLVFVYARDG